MIKVSITTTCFNSEKTVEDTLKSVLSQTYPDIEYVITDGGSTDGTMEIIKRYKNRIASFTSEKDKGLYDGINKAIKM